MQRHLGQEHTCHPPPSPRRCQGRAGGSAQEAREEWQEETPSPADTLTFVQASHDGELEVPAAIARRVEAKDSGGTLGLQPEGGKDVEVGQCGVGQQLLYAWRQSLTRQEWHEVKDCRQGPQGQCKSQLWGRRLHCAF